MIDIEQKLNQYYIRICDEYCDLAVCWLRTIRSENENLTTSRSRHHFYELQYVLDGGLSFRLSDQDMRINAGEFVLVPPDCYHEITGSEENTRKLVFGFDVELNIEKISEGLTLIEHEVKQESKTMRDIAELLDSLLSMQSNTIGIQLKNMTEAFLFAMIDVLLPNGGNDSSKTKSCYKKNIIEQMLTYIRAHAGSGFVTVDELAGLFHISKRHLSRICMDTLGKTPREILDEERLRYIRELLSTTPYTLNEIAFITGFNSEQSLVRFFKAKESCTPGRYRKDAFK